MHTDLVEIYSDATNAAVMRHPGRNYPGVLLQGDTLWTLCHQADAAVAASPGQGRTEANVLRNALWGLLSHYKVVLAEHGIPLPFSDL